jgi:SpoVK/Ycf46/Vps4 family AAA+-type ATPase
LAAILQRARSTDNVYRGQTLRIRMEEGRLHVDPVRPVAATRDEVVHSPAVWAEVDANVGALVRNGAAMRAAGLGASRGILICGPPGVGKTALCRVIANELPPGTTVILLDASNALNALGRVYAWLDVVAPAAVFIDDIDLVAGDRRKGTGGGVLREFLTSLDGLAPTTSVLTIATTNVTDTIDPALLRPGRFDALIEVPPPNRGARAEILRRLLAPFGEFDVDRIADVTDGLTGADLREVVRRAVLEHGDQVTTNALHEVVRSGRWKPKPATGNYL